MDWGLTDDDLRFRDVDEDEHRFLRVTRNEGKEFFLIEHRPKQDPVYSKRISWFTKTDNLADCVQTRVDYFDKSGEFIKKLNVKWQKISDAWVWKTAVIKKTKTLAQVVYDTKKVDVNVNLTDDVFSKRSLRRGYRGERID